MTTEVLPFRGLRYNKNLVPDASLVVSPPYDIIGPQTQLHYLQKHPNNAIHLDYGLMSSEDSDADNRYTHAASLLKEWLAAGILTAEDRPAIYFLREEYLAPDGTRERRDGFIVNVKLSDFSEGKILPHEHTASGPKEDRLKLIEATEANLSPIFSLYSDPDDAIAERAAELAGEAAVSLTDEAGTQHTLWVLDEPETVEALSAALSQKTLVIADGHHRYETMLAYRDARRAQEQPDSDRPYDFTMMYLSNMDGDSRSILPIHRFVSDLSEQTLAGVNAALAERFEIREVPGEGQTRQENMTRMMLELNGGRNAFGMYVAGDDSYHVLVARTPRPMLTGAEDSHSVAYRSLDVAVLDRIILQEALGIRPDGASPAAGVKFVERTEAAFRKINEGTNAAQIALLVNPTSMEEIRAVAENGEKMPRKSTYFYPKPLTGLVFRSLNI